MRTVAFIGKIGPAFGEESGTFLFNTTWWATPEVQEDWNNQFDAHLASKSYWCTREVVEAYNATE